MTKGLIGSGKTTWARQLVRDNPNQYKIVCRDDLRSMLDGSMKSDNKRPSKDQEKFVKHMRDVMVRQILESKRYSVIVADTNLSPSNEAHFRQLVKEHNKLHGDNVQFEIKSFLDVPLDECIRRDAERKDSVGEKAIRQMYNQHLRSDDDSEKSDKIPSAGEKAIIVDMDGTLSFPGNRNVYDATGCEKDAPNIPVVDLVRLYQQNHNVIIITGRDERFRAATETWLKTYNITPQMVLMRQTGDKRKDFVVKEELIRQHLWGQYNIIFALDDRDGVVETYRRLGIATWQVNWDNK